MSVNNIVYGGRVEAISLETATTAMKDRVSTVANTALSNLQIAIDGLLRMSRTVASSHSVVEDRRDLNDDPTRSSEKSGLAPVTSAPHLLKESDQTDFVPRKKHKSSDAVASKKFIATLPSPFVPLNPTLASASSIKTPQKWERWEDDILRSCHSLKQAKKTPRLKHRSANAIKNRWGKFRPENKQLLPWTEEEDNLLRACPFLKDAKKDPKLNHHTQFAIANRWNTLRPEDKKSPLWAEWEDNILRAYTSLQKAQKDPRLQHRSPSAMKNRWHLLTSKARELLKGDSLKSTQ